MKRFFSLLLCFCLLICVGCAQQQSNEDGALHILATTYPIYLFTKSLTEGIEGVEVTQLIDETVSCLHDYTLTVPDMKAIERADIIILNGVDLESFMEDALDRTDAVTIDCSQGIDLLPADGHEHHRHEEDDHHHGHYDPHYWLDAEAVPTIISNILIGLSASDKAHVEEYHANFSAVMDRIPSLTFDASSLSCPYLITFHDGFRYLAHDNGLTLLKSIEEEEGSTASAADIKEIVALIREYNIPAIFTEKYGSDKTAQTIARETGVKVYQLDMLMSGEGQDISTYFDAINANYAIIREALS